MECHKWFFAVVLGGVLLGLSSSPANAQEALTCMENSGVPNIVRTEGGAELMGDVVLTCTGGVPTLAGQPIPLQTVQLFLSTNITSRIVGAGNLSEALLLIDEPYPSANLVPPSISVPAGQVQAQLACLANNTTNCAITSVGPGVGSVGSYNGSPGQYNVFQGSQTSVNAITWVGVPIDAPGTAGTRVIRITNIRANAYQLGVSSKLVPTQISAIVAVNGSQIIFIQQPSNGNVVGQAVPGVLISGVLSGAYTQCVAPSGAISVTASEGFAQAFRPQTYGQIISAQAGSYTGPNNASETYQNIPGFNYSTESAFRPDPAIGAGTFVDPSGIAGLATQGTQLQFNIAGAAAGVSVSVPSYIYLSGAYGQGAPLGVAVLVGQTPPAVVVGTGAPSQSAAPGPNVPLTVTGGTATAIYEIYYADSHVQETVTVPVTVSYAAGVATGTSTVTTSFTPLSTNSRASSSEPIPNFFQPDQTLTLFSIAACANAVPALTSISPNSGLTGTTVPVTLTGTNFVTGATVNVNDSGVSVSNVSVVSPTQITATFTIAANTNPMRIIVNVTTVSGTSGVANFTVNPSTPTLTSIAPNGGLAGTTVAVSLTGTNFVAGATVNVGNSGVSVSDVSVVSPTRITATFAIAANAAVGPASVTVTTSGGTSAAASFGVNASLPALTSIAPNSGLAGTTVAVSLTGTNFVAGATVNVSTLGVTVSKVSVVSPTEITATFAIAANAPPVPVIVTVSSAGAVTGPVSFTISPSVPTLTSISPSSGVTGSTVQVSLTGTNFLAGATVNTTNPGVAIGNVSVVSPTQITATFGIAANAPPGAFSVTVTTLRGTSGAVSFTISPPPLITLSTAALSFNYIQGNSAPAAQSFGVLSAGGTANYSVSAATSTGGDWLAVSPASGQTPGNVLVSLQNLTAMTPGMYEGTLTIQPQNSSIVAQTIAVSLQVTSVQPQVSLSSKDLRFSVNASSPAVTGYIQVLNTGGGTVNYSVAPGPASWLTISCGGQGSATPSNPGLICVQLNPANLSASTYFDSLTVTSAGQQLPVNVTLQVSSSATSILLSSTGMTFTAIAGASNVSPASQTVAVLNTGQGTMNWTAQLSGSAAWLTLSSASGSSQALGASQPAITFTPNPVGLAAGNYYALANVTVPDGSAPNSPAPITVLLRVLPANTQLPPTVSTSGLIFTAAAGGAAPAAQQINLVNGEESALSYSFNLVTSDGHAWMGATPASGSLPAGGSSPLSVQVNPAGLAAGVYYGQLQLGYSNSTEENVDVVFAVTQPSNAQAQAQCAQNGIVFDQQVPTDGGTVVAGQQYTLRLKSLCVPSPPSGLNAEIDFSDGTGPLFPAFDSGSGDYEVTWTPTQAESVKLYAQSNPVNTIGLTAAATKTQPFSVTVSAPDPAGSPILEGVRNSASYTTANEVAAGSFVSIFGAQFANAATSASSVPFPTQLGGVQATLGGTALPLYYASAGQVNALIPFLPNQLLDASQTLVVYRNGAPTSLNLNLVAYQPGIFSTASNGQGQGAIQNASYQLVDGIHPAQAGETIIIYCGGLGPVANPPAAGAVASPGSITATMPDVYIDGIQAQVVYSGLSPGSVQLYQVNAIVPQGTHSGAVNVYVTVTDPRSNVVLQSNTVTIN
jgi:uncharacterized protein (TIGR03437 family)